MGLLRRLPPPLHHIHMQPKRRLRLLLALLVVCLVVARGRHSFHAPDHRITVPSPATEIATAISANHRLTSADVSQPQFAQALCQQHGWHVFDRAPALKHGAGRTKRKVYDLFTINTELDWLEIRLNATYDFVDYFVIVEGARTFTGIDKPLYLKDNWAKLAPYHDKIIYHELEYPPDFHPTLAWDYEGLQRNALFTQVFPRLKGPQAPLRGDVLIVADVDEIPRPETLIVLRACEFPSRLTLRSRFYYYSFEFLHRGIEWSHPQATTYRGHDGTILPDDLRNGDGLRQWGIVAPLLRWFEKGDLWNAAWHCSSCFATIAELQTKLESFSHMSLNKPEYRNPDRIVDRVRNGKDLWDRPGEMYDFVENNDDIPPPLKMNRDRWTYLVDRQGDSAGFVDYP